MGKRILLGMSGGLDSASAVLLLRNAGYEVVGAVLRMHGYTDTAGAAECAAELEVELRTVDCRAEFEAAIPSYFCSEYLSGRTPNPCVLCNEKVKFACLIREADRAGCEMIATGHYADVRRTETGRFCVACAEDTSKDQSYMLWRIGQETLARTLFPLCRSRKDVLRSTARKAGLAVAEKRDSQEICFIPDGDYAAYIERRTGISPVPGEFVDCAGNPLGTHGGILRYTVGQRKGIGAHGAPMFVSRIDAVQNRVYLSREDEKKDTLTVSDLVFSGDAPFEGKRTYEVKLRYRAQPTEAEVTVEGGVASVRLTSPVRAVTPGQSAVFYRDGAVCFGGIID